MTPSWLSLIPFLIVIPVSIITKQVQPGLFVALLVGSYLVEPSLLGGIKKFLDYIVHTTIVSNNIRIIIFLYGFAGLINIIKMAGGIKGFVDLVSKKVKTKRSAMALTWLSTIGTFSDPDFRIVTIAPIMKALKDRLKMSARRIGIVIEVTSNPVVALVPIATGFVGYMVSIINTALKQAGIHRAPYLTYVESIPFNFFSFAILGVGIYYTFFMHRKHEKKYHFTENEKAEALNNARKSSETIPQPVTPPTQPSYALLNEMAQEPMPFQSITTNAAPPFSPVQSGELSNLADISLNGTGAKPIVGGASDRLPKNNDQPVLGQMGANTANPTGSNGNALTLNGGLPSNPNGMAGQPNVNTLPQNGLQQPQPNAMSPQPVGNTPNGVQLSNANGMAGQPNVNTLPPNGPQLSQPNAMSPQPAGNTPNGVQLSNANGMAGQPNVNTLPPNGPQSSFSSELSEQPVGNANPPAEPSMTNPNHVPLPDTSNASLSATTMSAVTTAHDHVFNEEYARNLDASLLNSGHVEKMNNPNEKQGEEDLQQPNKDYDEKTPSRPWNLILPLGTVLLLTLFLSWWDGHFKANTFFGAFIKVDALGVMLEALLITLILTIIFFMVQKFPVAKIVTHFINGGNQLMSVIVLLALIWGVSAVSEDLGFSKYITMHVENWIPPSLVAPVLFLLGAVISYFIGSSWGTWGLLMPLGIMLAHHANANIFLVIGAVFASGTFGAFASPLSDNTVTLCTILDLPVIEYAKSKLVPALIAAGIACVLFIGFSFIL
jgi:Na+/H+ antiporter NhaC